MHKSEGKVKRRPYQDLGSPKWRQFMLQRSMSSVCQANVLFHIPKYRYGVLTPLILIPLSCSTVSRIVFKWPMFHSLTSLVGRMVKERKGDWLGQQCMCEITKFQPGTFTMYTTKEGYYKRKLRGRQNICRQPILCFSCHLFY